MIEYKSDENVLVFELKHVPQNDGNIIEEINVDSYDSNYQYFFEFLCPQKIKFISEIIDFSNSSTTGILRISSKVTENVGKVFAQLVIRDKQGNLVRKSLMTQKALYVVDKSINAISTIQTGEVKDVLSSLLDIGNKTQEIGNKLQSDAENGKFNGKDGTIIKVNDLEQKIVEFSQDPQMQINQLSKKIKFVKHTSNFSLKFDTNDMATVIISGCPYGKMEIYVDDVLTNTVNVAPNITLLGVYTDNVSLCMNYANKSAETVAYSSFKVGIELKMYNFYGNIVVFEE